MSASDSNAESEPNVFRYLDARAYLRAYYTHKKQTTRTFSYRAFSRRAGLKSPNYLKLVIDGDRNLTAQMAHRFGQALGLSGQRLAYFLDLVAFTQAKTTDERSDRYQRLIRFREHRAIHQIDIAYGQYHTHWYIPAIRELTFRPDCKDDPAWIAERLLPPIREEQAREAVELLIDLELIERVDGRLCPTESLVTTGPEVKGLHYVQFHRTMLQRAEAALELPAAQRDISSVTLCMDRDAIPRLKEIVRGFRRQLLQLSASESAPEQVIQVNLQIFPLTTPDEG